MTLGEFSLKEYTDGSIRILYEDYGVEMFGGGDYEATYVLDSENRKLLEDYLKDSGNQGALEEMLISEFGKSLEKKSFAAVCDANGIKYELNTWIG